MEQNNNNLNCDYTFRLLETDCRVTYLNVIVICEQKGIVILCV